MIYNCVVSLRSITGASNNKSQAAAVTGIRGLIIPASNEVLMMYPEIPVGQTFSYNFIDNGITISPETEIKVTDAFNPELAINDIFIVSGVVRKSRIGCQILLSGICVRKDA